MDIATFIGLALGLGAIIGGAMLEGLHLGALIQPTAALIVLGGTFGAAFISFPLSVAIQAFKDTKKLISGAEQCDELIAEICDFATKVRKNGIISLEQEVKNVDDRFMKKAISLSGVSEINSAVGRTPLRRIETPSKTQSEVLSAFGYRVDESGVLQGPAG